jgi:hypothetical protein
MTPGDKERTAQIFATAEAHLRTARLGLSDMQHVPGRANPGFHNAVVFGRMVTWALENLRGVTSVDFDAWYAPKVQEMKADPLMVYFKDLRTKIEKQAHSPLATRARLHRLSTRDLPKLFGEPPPGAVGRFIGDSDGASGWEIRGFDGQIEKYYVAMPVDMVTFEFKLSDLDLKVAAGRTPGQLAAVYLDELGKLLAEAKQRFG